MAAGGASADGLSLTELAALCGGRLAGDAGPRIHGVATLETAGPADLAFLTHPRYRDLARTSRAAALLVAAPWPEDARPQLIHDNPLLALAKIIEAFHSAPAPAVGVAPGAHVDPTARLGSGVAVQPGAVVAAGVRLGARTVVGAGAVVEAAAQIGEDCRLGSGAVVGARCRLGDRVVLQPGAVVGSEGFGYARDGERWHKIPHLGTVVLEDGVELGANACVDRATLGTTVIGAGSKLDNLVQVAHNVRLGRHVAVAAQAGLAGSCQVEDGAELGGQVGLAGHLTIGAGARIAAQSGVPRDVPAGAVMAGYPAVPIARWRRMVAALDKLAELRQTVAGLARRSRDDR